MAQNLFPGSYRVSSGNIRDKKHNIIRCAELGDKVKVLRDAPGQSRFSTNLLGLNSQEHTWVVHYSNKIGKRNYLYSVEGWISNANIKEQIFKIVSGERWTNGERTIAIRADRFGHYVAIDVDTSKTVGFVQSIYHESSKILELKGITADVNYPGLGSLLLLDRIENSNPAYLKASAMVGSLGYYKKLGFDIPDEFVSTKEQIAAKKSETNLNSTEGPSNSETQLGVVSRDQIREANKKKQGNSLLQRKEYKGTQTIPIQEPLIALRNKSKIWKRVNNQ